MIPWPPGNDTRPLPLVYLIGDSIRGSYQRLIEALFGKQATVDGPRDNSFDSANIRRRLDEWLAGTLPNALALNCGLHDVRRARPDGNLQVPLEAYLENLDGIMGRIVEHAIPRPLWVTTTPVNETVHNANREYDRFNADIDRYNAAALSLALRHGWEVVDLHGVILGGPADRFLAADGVHLNDNGRLAAAGALLPALRERIDACLGLEAHRRSESHVQFSVGYRLE